MNKTEEYLDSLLNNVSPERKAEAERKRRRTSVDFLKEFENELQDADIDDEILEFENETLSKEEPGSRSEDSFFDNLEGIVHTAKEEAAAKQQKSGEDVFEVNTLDDDSWTGQTEDGEQPKEEKADTPSDGQELLDLLSELPSAEDISDLSGSGRKEQQDDSQERQETSGSKGKDGKTDQKKKGGFFGKLSKILFGDDEDELSESEEGVKLAEAYDGQGSLSDENAQILKDLEESGASGQEESEKKKKGKKKKEKKEKKPKEPKEKKAKKEKKPKKPKKPKEVDLSPPLPKKPVVLIFVMCFSVMFLVILASNLLGYSISISDARAAYRNQDYTGAYEKVAGLDIKSGDETFGNQVFVLAKVQSELKNGDGLYLSGQYVMALDSYICALGRYDANYEDAVLYQVQQEYGALEAQITAQLQEKFGVSAETAREIYGLGNRTEYTKRVHTIVKELGLAE